LTKKRKKCSRRGPR